MAITQTLIKINGITLPKVRKYSVQYNKLWKDSDRNMAGAVSASLIGIFPKILLEFASGLTRDEVGQITSLLNKSYFAVEYYDPETNTVRTAQYYAGDFTPELMERERELFHGFSVNLVPVAKR